MNPSTIPSSRSRSTRFAFGLFSVFAAVSMAANAGTEKVVMGLGGKKFGHGLSMTANSGTKLINPSKLYSYRISGKIKGKGGDPVTGFGKIYPNAITLSAFVKSRGGDPTILSGAFSNPTGGRGITLMRKSYNLSDPAAGIDLSMVIETKVSATGQISLDIKNVSSKVFGTIITGEMVFQPGSYVEVSTAPIVEFKAIGQTAFQETAGNASVIVRRLGNKDKAASVGFSTTNGTAVSPLDYTTTTGTVSFAAGETEKTILVPIIDNTTDQGTRRFTINLSTPGKGTILGTKLVNTVAIADND